MNEGESSQKNNTSPRWVDIAALEKYIPYKRDVIQRLIRDGGIPFYMPKGKYIFDLDEIDVWIKTKKDD